MKTQVAIIGSGPAGLLLSEILHRHGIESVVLEKRSREHVLSRIRAGVLEQGTAEALQKHGISERIHQEGRKHDGFNIVWGNHSLFIDLFKHMNQRLTVYGQTEIQKDLFIAADKRNAMLLTEVDNVRLMSIDSDNPQVIFNHRREEIRLHCDFIAGCDGFNGVSRNAIPGSVLRMHDKTYPFGWLGVLSASPPLPHITYAKHSRGFALASMRNAKLSRYYIQVPADTNINDWSDDKFWFELKARFPTEIADEITTGPVIEKSIAMLRSIIVEQMRYGRLFLAGDAAHILPPTGAKGLNLAVSDIIYLSRAFIDFYQHGSNKLLDNYSDTALRRVWHSMRTAWYMTKLLHTFPHTSSFNQKAQEYELMNLKSSQYAQATLAEWYVGMAIA